MIEKEVTLREAVDMFNILKKFRYEGVKFNYAIAKLLLQLDKEMNIIREATQPSVEFQNYSKQLAKAQQDQDQKKVEQLQKKFKNVIEERDKQLAEAEKMLDDTTITLKIHQVTFNEIPKNINTTDMTWLMKMEIISDDKS